MAKLSLLSNMKFRKLLRGTGLSRAVATGHLELMWMTAHAGGGPVFADADEVELAADWEGEPGVWAAGLVEYGFLDEVDDGLAIHDYWEHAPEYVKRRQRRKHRSDDGSVTDRPLSNTELSPPSPTEPSQVEPSQVEPSQVEPCQTEPSPTTTSRECPVEPGQMVASLGSDSADVHPQEYSASRETGKVLLARIEAMTKEPLWHAWWRDVVSRLERKSVNLEPLWAAADYVAMCADPVQRAAKDLGPLKKPGAYLAKKAIALCKTHRVAWPDFPKRRQSGLP